MSELRSLMREGEALAEYSTSWNYIKYRCIIRPGRSDILAALNDTLHRILEAGGTERDVEELLGAKKCTEEEITILKRTTGCCPLDEGFCLPGAIWWKVAFH